MSTSAPDHAELAADRPAPALRRELGRLDTVFFLMSAMVVVDTVGAVAAGGGQAFTWLAVLFVTFFVPSAMITAELGAALPHEGGAYVWVREAFGPLAGAFTSTLYWAGTPTWLGGSVAAMAIAVYRGFFGPLPHAAALAFGVSFVAFATLGAMLPLRWGKWIPTSGAVGQIVLLTAFTATVIAYGVRHGFRGVASLDFRPSTPVFVAVVPVLLYSFVGVELPSTAAEEMRDPRRDVPAAIARAGVGQALMYGLPTLAILVVLPIERITSLHGLVDAMSTVFTVYGADAVGAPAGAGLLAARACAALFIWVLLASGSAWIMGAGRAQAAACSDGAGPAWLGAIAPRAAVPMRIAAVSGALSVATLTLHLTVTHGDGEQYFAAALASAISLIVLAYLLIFPAILVLRRRRPTLERPYRVPGGRAGVAVAAIAATSWSAVAAACLLWPGIGTGDPAAALPAAFHGDRWRFELLVLAPVSVVVAIGAAFYAARGVGVGVGVRPGGGRSSRSPRRGS